MKKGLLGILLLLLAGLAVPKFIGDRAYEVYKQSIDNAPMDKGRVSIEHRDYSPSWFSTDVVTVIKYEPLDPAAGTMEWVLTSHILHGPLIVTDEGIRLGLAYVEMKNSIKGLVKESQEIVDRILNRIAIKMTTLIDFDEKISSAFTVAPFTRDQDGVKAAFGGFELLGTAKLDYSSLDGSITLHESSVESADFTFKIANSSARYNLGKPYDSILLGSAKGVIPAMDIVAQQVPVSLENIVFSTDEWEVRKNIYFKQQFAIQKIKAPIPVEALQYDTELNRLSLEAVKGWAKFSQNYQPDADGNFSAEDEKRFHELLALTLQQGPEFNQYFKLDGMGGALIIDWDSRYVGLPGGEQLWEIKAEEREKLLGAVDMRILLSIDRVIVDATPFAPMVAPYMEQGFVVEEAGLLKADIKLLNGALSVNGQTIPVASILPLLGQQKPQ